MNKKADGNGWIIAIVIYFICFITIAVTVTSLTGGEVNGINAKEFCDNPRTIYNTNYFDVDIIQSDKIEDLSSLQCFKTFGAFDEQNCNMIKGCNYQEVAVDVNFIGDKFETLLNIMNVVSFNAWNWTSYFVDNDKELNTTGVCLGLIKAEDYGIATYTDIFNNEYVAAHENTKNAFNQRGSICNSPAVINNKTNCEMFSCTWGGVNSLNNDINNSIELPTSPVGAYKTTTGVLKTIGNLVTFRYDFGIDDNFTTMIITFLLFYLPLLALILVIYDKFAALIGGAL